MVSKITLIEPHFDGAQFGPSSIETPEAPANRGSNPIESEDSSDSPTKSRRIKFLQGATVFVVMFVTLYTVLRWVLSRENQQEQ